ncbi:RNA 2',3'-cyclic phosphodiesterase [Maritalea porphyrae]|uniref:RNA 2',3'-cyclic phosphodiesterase n=1 Tax=Maritalea porphyrae TaxID=880732 RepID=A0ABQ5UPJ6_9HYPH|nr:RNA 2',3'-cyclic phosphodiesterase [Maritalea porphyrae]GLQ16794.1 RNA 2',3'-cyclic phosphodiesterase [Maritalea porphyrae]
MPRLFTGLEIPSDVSFALSLKRGGLGKSRWIDPSNYHITLRYIGDVDNHTGNAIANCLDELRVEPPFTVTVNHLGVFGGNRPRILYAGLEPCDQLTALHEMHERALQRLGLKPDGRKFVPHITLARLNGESADDMARHIQLAGAFFPLTFTVDQFVLYSAKDSVGGGPYLVEERYDLVA